MTSNTPTHKVEELNKKPITTIDVFRADLKKDYFSQIKNYFHGDDEKSLKFMSAVVFSVKKVPKLLECDRDSLLQAFMYCAEYELYPSGVAGEAYVLPYKDQAQFQLGYKGIITLLWRAGISIRSKVIYAADKFDYEEGLEPKLIHKPNIFGERGAAIGVYAIATLPNGEKQYHMMSEKDVMKFKNLSQAKNSEYSPWNSKQDPEKWMWQKTCIKQLAKTLPLTEDMKRVIAEDNKDSIIESYKAKLDIEGPAVGAALHEPSEPAAPAEQAKAKQAKAPASKNGKAKEAPLNPDSDEEISIEDVEESMAREEAGLQE